MRSILLILALVLLPTIETAKEGPKFWRQFKSQFQKVPWLWGKAVESPQVDRGFGVQYCLIPKAGSVVTRAILCDVLKEYKNITYTPKWGNVTAAGTCDANRNYPNGWPKWVRPRTNVIFTVVRDPLERFISTYEFLCKSSKMCASTVKNIHQFARWVHLLQTLDFVGLRPRSRNLDEVVWHSWPQTKYSL
ncbi:unnamed protein product, partial [Mesorhabditis belari]|uniref:Sulfotransferase n=1 Tax=Mesorhabditis belari TaxID=2138241 RepID=A0AAF3EJR7_9BILA